MKKILILALTAVASLGLTFGTALAFSAAGDNIEITELDDLIGTSTEFNFDGFPASSGWTLNIYFNYSGDEYSGFGWSGESFFAIPIEAESSTDYISLSEQQTLNFYTSQTLTVEETVEGAALGDINGEGLILSMTAYNEPLPSEPVETPTMWQAILSGIGGFFSGMFSVLSGLFSGVVEVFYTNNTTTIILQALIFAAAAGLVAAAVYVIVRLIKSAVARLRGGVGAADSKHLARERKKLKKHFKNLRKYNANKERYTRKYIKRHYKK